MRSAVLSILLLTLAACGQGPGEGPVQTYRVEGVIAQLPAGPGTELMIRHAEIPDFVDATGDTVGMSAMTMGFPLAEGLALDGFAPGDSVDIVFEVRWNQPRPLALTEIQRR